MSKAVLFLDQQAKLNIIAFIRIVNSKVEIISDKQIEVMPEVVTAINPDLLIIDIDYIGKELSEDILGTLQTISNIHCWVIVLSNDLKLEIDMYRKYHCYHFHHKERQDFFMLNSMIVRLLSYKISYDDSLFKKTLSYYSQGKKHSVPVKHIVCAEIYYKRCTLQMKDGGRIDIGRLPLSKLLEQLPKNFIQCHRSYVVNKDYAKALSFSNEENYIQMISPVGDIPVGRIYKNMIKDLELGGR